ncbi:MAG: amidase family protein, partial [Minicystis sp.]
MGAFSSDDLIQLPRLSGAEASLLLAELLAVAQQQGALPGPIERSRVRLSTVSVALGAALKSSVEPLVPPGIRRRAERAAAAAWEATFDWLSGWCKLEGDDNPHRPLACDLFALLFPSDAGKESPPSPRIEDGEGTPRLARLDLDREAHLATFDLLGGKAFLDQLRKAQRALDLTAGAPREDAAAVREQIAAAAAALRSGRVTSVELVETSLLAVDKFDPELNAVAHLLADEARAEAAARDAEAAAGHWRGPLHGIPITVKDVIDVAGAPTRAGSAAYDDLPLADAAAVARA